MVKATASVPKKDEKLFKEPMKVDDRKPVSSPTNTADACYLFAGKTNRMYQWNSAVKYLFNMDQRESQTFLCEIYVCIVFIMD